MKQTKTKDIKDLMPEQLEVKVEELRRELLHLRLRAATSQIASYPSDKVKLERSIACVLTVLRQKRGRVA
jgi:ribosomal protein L29